jgi:hypothetical protein
MALLVKRCFTVLAFYCLQQQPFPIRPKTALAGRGFELPPLVDRLLLVA